MSTIDDLKYLRHALATRRRQITESYKAHPGDNENAGAKLKNIQEEIEAADRAIADEEKLELEIIGPSLTNI